MTRQVGEILQRARALVRAGWIKGQRVDLTPNGARYCAMGAIYVASARNATVDELAAYDALGAVVPGNIIWWNDDPKTTHEMVIAGFDRAIAKVFDVDSRQ